MAILNHLRPVLLASFVLLGWLLASPVAAQTLDVDFEDTPLFLDADVKPGDSETRTVTVTNNGTDSETVYVDVQNDFNTGLADVMEIMVASGGTTYADTFFANFFSTSPIELGTLDPGDSRTYDFTAALDNSVGNAYQRTELGFDLVIGFEDGESTTDTPGGRGGSGGGGSSGGTRLILRDEGVQVNGSSATITWNTNLDATSYVVCGDTAEGPFTLTDEYPHFGYDFRIPEQTSRIRSHALTETGLAAGEYECRPASRRDTSDRFTTGDPVTFTIPAPEVAGAAISRPATPPLRPTSRGSVLGMSKDATGGLSYDEWRAELDRANDARTSTSTRDLADTPTSTNSTATENDLFSANGADDSGGIPGGATTWGLLALFLASILGYVVYQRNTTSI